MKKVLSAQQVLEELSAIADPDNNQRTHFRLRALYFMAQHYNLLNKEGPQDQNEDLSGLSDQKMRENTAEEVVKDKRLMKLIQKKAKAQRIM